MKTSAEQSIVSSMHRYCRLMIGLLLLSPMQFSSAHEFWIEADSVSDSLVIALDLRVGDGFPGERFPRSIAHIDQFFVQQGQHRLYVYGEPGSLPAGIISNLNKGSHVAAYRSTDTAITLPAKKFESYLREEGLDHVIELRRQRNESHLPGREVYSRAAKALFQIGPDEGSGNPILPLGFALEIIPQANPAQLQFSDFLTVQVLFEDKPLVNTMLSIFDADHPKGDRSRRNDENGYAQVPLSADGRILVGVVHMVEAPAELDADWESIWASLTFQAPGSKKSL